MKTDQKEDTTQDLTVPHKLEMVKCARKWFRKITSIINEVLTHLTWARNLASFFLHWLFSLCLLKKSHRTLPFHMHLKVQIQIFNIGKRLIFYFGRLVYFKK